MNGTLVETIRAMLDESRLPKHFWFEKLSTVVCLWNRIPTRSAQGIKPYEVKTGKKAKCESSSNFWMQCLSTNS